MALFISLQSGYLIRMDRIVLASALIGFGIFLWNRVKGETNQETILSKRILILCFLIASGVAILIGEGLRYGGVHDRQFIRDFTSGFQILIVAVYAVSQGSRSEYRKWYLWGGYSVIASSVVMMVAAMMVFYE